MRLVPLALCLCACGPLHAVPRYPYVEDGSLALVDELLVLEVAADRVDVRARLRFEGELRDRHATFPVGEGFGRAEGFTAKLGDEPAPAHLGELGALPAFGAREAWEIDLAGDALARGHGVLEVRYTQRGRGTFTYVLSSGAYWRGAIRELTVVVEDPGRRLARIEVEGAVIDDLGARRVIRLFDVEPRGGVRLRTR